MKKKMYFENTVEQTKSHDLLMYHVQGGDAKDEGKRKGVFT